MVIKLIKDFIITIIDVIYPQRNICLLCDEFSEEIKSGICPKCYNKLVYNIKTCEKCGRPLKQSYLPSLCHDCNNKQQIFKKGISPLIYEGYIRDCIHKFKYGKKPYMYKALGSIMLDYLNSLDLDFDIIIPVPLNKKRLLERGFNQAELLSKCISKHSNSRVITKSLVRTKNTRRQNKLNRKDRLKNIKGAFTVRNKEVIANKNIILVDDIYTTGTTINECCKELTKSGAKSIYVLTLAIGYNEQYSG
ncbi:ComF family protein [Clostridiaceae bacterium M8S5]|nr:ComF family protein [Clostridiaceae bacterium M8S5]